MNFLSVDFTENDSDNYTSDDNSISTAVSPLSSQHFRPRHAHSLAVTTTAISTSAQDSLVSNTRDKNHLTRQQDQLQGYWAKIRSHMLLCWHSIVAKCSYLTSNQQKQKNTHLKNKPASNFTSERVKMIVSVVYMVVIAAVVFIAALLSFLWMPEFHTTSLTCAHLNPSITTTTSRHGYSSNFQDLLKHSNMSMTFEMEYEHLFVLSKNTGT